MDEVKPFYFRTEGSIYREVYEYIVKPLSHPIGFTYNYVQVIKESIVDYFGLISSYVFNTIEVRSLDGTYHVFTPDTDDTNVKADFLTRINFLTGTFFTEAEYNQLVHVHLDHHATDLKFNNVDGGTEKIVYFSEGTILKQTVNPITVYYRKLSDENQNNDQYEETYSGQSSLYLDYDITFQVDYTDDIAWEIETAFAPETYNVQSDAIDSYNIQLINDNGYYFYTTDNQYIKVSDDWYMYAYDL
jgi:hypothetical protein